MAAAIVGVATSPSLAGALVFTGIGGAAEMAHWASNAAVLQMSAPEAMRGRISSLLMLSPGLISVGALLAGPLADLLGVRGASLALAAAATAAVLLLYFLSPALREMKLK
jgi:hypothetical protein